MRASNFKPMVGATRITQDGQNERDPYEVLAERLTAVLMGSSPTQDDNPNHAPAGNPDGGQFTSGPGGGGSSSEPSEKPTSAKAKTAKGKLHELLSSGHGFTKAELMKIAGFEAEVTLNTWLSKFKSQKHAGDYGALDIKKMPNGVFQVVKANGELAGPNPNFKPASPLPTEEPPPAAPGLKTKKEADATYEQSMSQAMAQTLSDLDDGHDSWDAVKKYKTAKAKAMAEWANSLHGANFVVKKQGLFKADKVFASDLKAANAGPLSQLDAKIQEALAQWKKNTQLEKQGKFDPTKKPAEAGIQSGKEDSSTEVIQQAMKNFTSSGPAKQLSYDILKPKDFTPISASDFTKDKTFGKGIEALGQTLRKSGKSSAIQNKQLVEQSISAKLKNSQAFQQLDVLVRGGSSANAGTVRRLVTAWAQSSGDGNPLSCALQLAVQRAFSIPDEHLEKKALHSIKPNDPQGESLHKNAATHLGISLQTPEELGALKNALQDFIVAQYETTQELLKENGFDHVYVARGMRNLPKADHQSSEAVNLKLQPASSFSTNLQVAGGFSNAAGAIFLTKVPVSQVLGTYVSGFGCTEEHEVVVIGHESIPSFGIPYQEGLIDVATVQSAMQKKLETVA